MLQYGWRSAQFVIWKAIVAHTLKKLLSSWRGPGEDLCLSQTYFLSSLGRWDVVNLALTHFNYFNFVSYKSCFPPKKGETLVI